MKFLPVIRPLVLVATALTLNACETPANRRELYNTTEPNGAWHDYSRRRDAEVELGLAPGSTSVVAPPTVGPVTPMPRSTRPTAQPRSGPLQADPTSLPSSAPAPGPGATTTVSPAAAVPPAAPGESAPGTSTSTEAPIAPPQQ